MRLFAVRDTLLSSGNPVTQILGLFGPTCNLLSTIHEDISFSMSKNVVSFCPNGVGVYLHIEQGSETPSQEVTQDACRDAYNARF